MEVAASRDVLVIIKFIQRQTVITQGEQENIYIYIYSKNNLKFLSFLSNLF